MPPDEKKVEVKAAEWDRILDDLASMQEREKEVVARERILKEQTETKFRELVEKRLQTLAEEVNGHPTQTMILLTDLTGKLDQVIDIKENQLPPYMRKILAALIPAWVLISVGLFTSWWHLSGLSHHLPKLIELLEKMQ